MLHSLHCRILEPLELMIEDDEVGEDNADADPDPDPDSESDSD